MKAERADLAAVLALLAVVNVSASLSTSGWVSATISLVGAAVAVMAARRRGYTTFELGLSRSTAGAGLRVGVATGAAIVGAVIVVTVVPATREFFSDQRFEDMTTAEVMYEAVFRIPIVTALTEELLFRAVLLAVLLRLFATRSAIALHAALFGLWHVLTTIEDLSGNDVTDSLGVWGQLFAVATTVLATGAAGVLFGWLRVRSGSVVAPWVAHIAFNASAFVAGAGIGQGWWF